MPTLRVHDFLTDSVLVSRESARRLEEVIGRAMDGGRAPKNPGDSAPLTIDFQGVAGIAPSFLDELISIFESLIGSAADAEQRRLIVANPPTRLSSKFEAVARGHNMSVQALPDGSWLLAGPKNSAP